jgi:DeoR/GlpR family transcriptional regulator of sugar metabolism
MDINKKKIKNIIENPIWLSVSETAKLCGSSTKTIRRAIKSININFKIVNERYFVELSSAEGFMHKNLKLKNKFYKFGLGQYIDKWKAKEWEKRKIEKKKRKKKL